MTVNNMLCIAQPLLVGFDYSHDAVGSYIRKYNPIGTNPSKQFQIKEIKNTSRYNRIDIRLKKAVTANQIFAIKGSLSTDTVVENTKTAKFPLMIQNVESGHIYKGIAEVHEGSDTIKVIMRYMNFDPGNKYRMISNSTMNDNPYLDSRWKSYDWTKWTVFKYVSRYYGKRGRTCIIEKPKKK